MLKLISLHLVNAVNMLCATGLEDEPHLILSHEEWRKEKTAGLFPPVQTFLLRTQALEKPPLGPNGVKRGEL